MQEGIQGERVSDGIHRWSQKCKEEALSRCLCHFSKGSYEEYSVVNLQRMMASANGGRQEQTTALSAAEHECQIEGE